MYLLFSLALMTSLGVTMRRSGAGCEARHFTLPQSASPHQPAHSPLPPLHLCQSGHPLPSPLRVLCGREGRLSPAVLAPPGLVGVEEALAEEEGMQGYLLQLGALAFLQRRGPFQLSEGDVGRSGRGLAGH